MKTYLLITLFALAASCTTSSTVNETAAAPSGNPDSSLPPAQESGWSIPEEQVFDGGPGKDGIPALANPEFVTIGQIDYLDDHDLVIGLKDGDIVRAYPHAILDWHEIVNDNLNDVSVAITYCPLTGTGIGWNRIMNGQETTFGVSGLLYNTNLIPYDRATDSNWSQILNESVNGRLIGEKAEVIPLFETDWATWKQLYPDSEVVSENTGFSRTYGISPYGTYNTNNELFFFPVPKDTRLPLKERVLAILDGDQAKAFRFSDVETASVIRNSFQGREYLISGNAHFMVAFELTTESSGLQFEYIWDGASDLLLADQEGNQWNVFGEATSGPRQGSRLQKADALMAFWFSIPAFYSTELY